MDNKKWNHVYPNILCDNKDECFNNKSIISDTIGKKETTLPDIIIDKKEVDNGKRLVLKKLRTK